MRYVLSISLKRHPCLRKDPIIRVMFSVRCTSTFDKREHSYRSVLALTEAQLLNCLMDFITSDASLQKYIVCSETSLDSGIAC